MREKLGAGAGAGVEVDPFDSVGQTDTHVKFLGEIGGNVGPLSLGAGIEVQRRNGGRGGGPCVTGKISVGPLGAEFDLNQGSLKDNLPTKVFEPNLGHVGLGAEGKVAGQVCGGTKF